MGIYPITDGILFERHNYSGMFTPTNLSKKPHFIVYKNLIIIIITIIKTILNQATFVVRFPKFIRKYKLRSKA